MSGLRERKKARTREAIQRHALRLFRERGYEATAMRQIAEAAEVAESTLFRYFPTKEDLALWDPRDAAVLEALRRQPPELPPLPALRAAFRQGLGGLPAAERAEMRERIVLLLSIPAVSAAGLGRVGGPLDRLTAAVAERAGRRSDDDAVRTLVGAVVGACLVAVAAGAADPEMDVAAVIDAAMARLEAGLPL